MRHRLSVNGIKPPIPRAVFNDWCRITRATLPRGETRILCSISSMESADSLLGNLRAQKGYLARVQKREIFFDPDQWIAAGDETISGFTFDCPLQEQIAEIHARLDALFVYEDEVKWNESMLLNIKEKKSS